MGDVVGPGVDLFLLGPLPSPGGVLSLEVSVHGGNKAGIKTVNASIDGTPPRVIQGKGITWSGRASSKSSGRDTLAIELPIEESMAVGSAHKLSLEVLYVTANSFTNDSQRKHLQLPFVISSPAGQLLARCVMLLGALFTFAAFTLLGLYVARWVRAYEADKTKEVESVAYLIICALILSYFVGYWCFAWPTQKALSLHGDLIATMLVLMWFIVPFWLIWKDSTRLKERHYTLRLETLSTTATGDEPYRSHQPALPVLLSHREMAALLQKEGYRTRLWFGTLYAKTGTQRLHLRRGDPGVWLPCFVFCCFATCL
jgi:hypothetical protein